MQRLAGKPAMRPRFSCLEAARETGKPISLLLFARGLLTGTVAHCERYDIGFLLPGTEQPEILPKHGIKLAADPGAIESVAASLGVDAAAKERGLSASAALADRLRLDGEELVAWAEAERSLRAVLRDGDAVTGILRWFSRYELGLDLGATGPGVVLFRHALLALGPA
jgi:hypothetical protein